jgi:hypothetical protein
MASEERRLIRVTIIAQSAETRDGLQTYLSQAGLAARGTMRLGDIDPNPCAAVVLFPDEFSHAEVVRELSRLQRERPQLLPLLVTREPERYLELTEPDSAQSPPIVIPKPAWGWTILDAIRAALDAQREG